MVLMDPVICRISTRIFEVGTRVVELFRVGMGSPSRQVCLLENL